MTLTSEGASCLSLSLRLLDTTTWSSIIGIGLMANSSSVVLPSLTTAFSDWLVYPSASAVTV